MENTVGHPLMQAAAPGSHAAAVAVDTPVMIVIIVAAVAAFLWLTWKIYTKTR